MVLTTLIQIATLFMTNGAAPVPPRAIPAERLAHQSTGIVTPPAMFHFVGLVMFTEVPDGTPSARSAAPIELQPVHVVALMPSVKNWSHRHALRLKDDQRYTTIETADPPDVEDHLAVIAYEPNALISVTPNWNVVKPTQVDGVPYLHYIVLSGEHLRFVADDDYAPTLSELTLPKIIGGVSLQSTYQSPGSPTLAAVFEIPSGHLAACTGEATANRYDTKLTLRNHGTVRIETVDGTKSITFHGDRTIELGNVPASWLATRQSTPDQSHFQVYCQMTGGGNHCQLSDPPPATGCSDSNLRVTHPRPRRKAPSLAPKVSGNETVETSDIFCSTTTWP